MDPATKTEIINIENSNVTCQDLEDFPLQTQGAVGSNIGSSPVICGGSNKNACYRLESGKWHHFAYLLQGYVCMYYIRFAQILPPSIETSMSKTKLHTRCLSVLDL